MSGPVSRVFKNLKRGIRGSQVLRRGVARLDAVACAGDPLQSPGALAGQGPYKIVFIVPDMPLFSGGHTAVLRIGTAFAEAGHDVSYVTSKGASAEEMAENAKTNLPTFRGAFHSRDKLPHLKADLAIATKWDTAYRLLAHRANFGCRAYFVMDYEPYFYCMGDDYLLARNSYCLGLRMISLGRWNADIIRRETGESAGWIDFPVDPSTYVPQARRSPEKGRVVLAVYIKLESKRAPLILFRQLQHLEQAYVQMGVMAEINVFGMEKNVKLPAGKNLGKLDHSQLLSLYASADFGVVASLSNISLVNFEMAAAGLPVIDLQGGSAPAFFDKTEMLFIPPTPKALFEKIEYCRSHPAELEAIGANALAKVKKVTWEYGAQQFLEGVVGKNRMAC